MHDVLGLTSDCVYCWRLILKEYEPEIMYIKGEDNIVANAMSRLEYYPDINIKNLHYNQRMSVLVKLLLACSKTQRWGVRSKYVNSYINTVSLTDDLKVKDIVNNVFTNITEEEDNIYPLL